MKKCENWYSNREKKQKKMSENKNNVNNNTNNNNVVGDDNNPDGTVGIKGSDNNNGDDFQFRHDGMFSACSQQQKLEFYEECLKPHNKTQVTRLFLDNCNLSSFPSQINNLYKFN